MMAILFTSLYFLFSLPMNIDIPASIQTDLHTTISNDEEHLTNEKYKDKAELHGTYLTEGSSFLKDVSLSITHHTNKKWHIALKEGYDPSITFIDITNNGKKDILYKVALNKERTIFHIQLFEYKGKSFASIPLPSSQQISGEFQPNYKASIHDGLKKEQLSIDLTSAREKYIAENIYDKQGALLKKQGLQISPIINGEPITLNEKNGYSFRTEQLVAGVNDKDILAKIETTYHFKNGKWMALKQTFTPVM